MEHLEQFFIECRNTGLYWFCFTSFCDWSRKLVPLSQPIKCKTETNHELVVRGFPALHAVWLFYFEFIIGSQRYFSFLLIGRWLLWFWFLRRLIVTRPIGIDPWLGILLRWLLALYVSLFQCHALINDGSLALCTASEQCNLVYLKNTLFEGLYILLVKLNINPLNPKSDQRLISPYNLTGESFFKIMRKKVVITNLRSFDCYEFSLSVP